MGRKSVEAADSESVNRALRPLLAAVVMRPGTGHGSACAVYSAVSSNAAHLMDQTGETQECHGSDVVSKLSPPSVRVCLSTYSPSSSFSSSSAASKLVGLVAVMHNHQHQQRP